jgi:hypothetical protein
MPASCRSVRFIPRSQTEAPRGMTDIGDSQFHKGQPVWFIQEGGSPRAAEYVGEGEMSAWFGGAPTVIVIYPDTQTGESVEVDRVIARELA